MLRPGLGGKEKGGNRKRAWAGGEDALTEMEVFKRAIDLRQFAVSLGYAMDPRESWRGSAVLRRGGDKIVVQRRANGHYVFFSVRDSRDHGTIVDFLQRRRKVSLGGVRQILRAWTGGSAGSPLPRLEPTGHDRLSVVKAYQGMTVAWRHAYLERERGLPAAMLSSPRFAMRVRMDSRGNAVFPHFDWHGLCGYEIKNRGFTGFAPGGEKGLWLSRTRAEDRRLVLAESAIDALSHAALFPDAEDRTRYASLGGRPSAKQLDLLRATMAKLPEGSEIIAAFDADPAGRLLVKATRQALPAAQARGVLKTHLPTEEGKDWNDVLRDVIGKKKGGAST